MAFDPIISGNFNPEWDATLGRRSRNRGGNAPDNILTLDNGDLLTEDDGDLLENA